MRRVAVGRWALAGAAGLCLLLGCGIVLAPLAVAVAVAAVALFAIVAVAPLSWLATLVVFGVLTTPNYHVGEVLVADIAMVFALAVAAFRGYQFRIVTAHWWWLAFVAWCVAVTRSGPGLLPLLHTFAPIAAGYLAARLASPETIWRAIRWWAVISLATAPLLSDVTGRWSGLPGGPNELGLLSAALIVLAYALPAGSSGRLAQVLLGIGGLAATQSISGCAAAGIGMLALRAPRGRSLSVPKAVVIAGAALIIGTRHDLLLTAGIHSDQAAITQRLFDSVNPITGGGWLYSADTIASGLFSVSIDSVHNTYLQVLVDAGLVALVLLLVALAVTWQQSGREGRALLVATAVWLNTSGAFPDAAWGLIGLVLAAAVVPVPADAAVVEPRSRLPGALRSPPRVPASVAR